ncbi:hypothetical protein GCM10023143_18930 [Compostibacter hankyongensis]|uniref:Cytochrome c domain-containing protein n=2 Tax=Compostibacter hankyongensis TaxID=1007089 RepID=A0ABP8FT03_9BACT
MKKIYVPKGYHLELVASEPLVEEPVDIKWDGDGRMYVAEMRTYMQDVEGSNENVPVSRIVRLEDTDGDGRMDKSTVFIDSLVLPRMMLPLGDRLLTNETNSYNLWSYRDIDGDGKADEKALMYHNDAKDTRNLEHQRSGLIWNLDNWIYMSKDPARYRFVNNRLEVDSMPESPNGQWGLAHDNYGRLFFSLAGARIPALAFQQNPAYGVLNLNDQYEKGFRATWPVMATPDAQGGGKTLRPDSTLDGFTASCGQSVFRGDRLPADMRGDLFICEPVGRLVRRAKVTNRNGEIVLKNAYHHSEFLASNDMNFRPINTATGPDGCLYIVDMYHGIIQESTWTGADSYIRPQIRRFGLDKHIGKGRIYRLVHDGYEPGPQPHMLGESSSKLVTYLDHPNGWWRDNAQKLLVIRDDRSVIPALEKMASGEQSFWDKMLFWKKPPTILGRIHALWTLEGLNAIKPELLFKVLADKDPRLRKTAVWISETYLKKGDEKMLGHLKPLMNDSSIDVRFQLSLSLRCSALPEAKSMLQQLLAGNRANKVMNASWKQYEKDTRRRSLESSLAGMPEADKKLVRKGAVTFSQLCASCHGPDGKGLSLGGKSMNAPPLAGQARVNGDPAVLIRILLKGLSGPIDGQTYPDVMPSMETNDDEWIASVLSYIRKDLGNNASVVHPEQVKKIRKEIAGRKISWTLKELEK